MTRDEFKKELELLDWFYFDDWGVDKIMECYDKCEKNLKDKDIYLEDEKDG